METRNRFAWQKRRAHDDDDSSSEAVSSEEGREWSSAFEQMCHPYSAATVRSPLILRSGGFDVQVDRVVKQDSPHASTGRQASEAADDQSIHHLVTWPGPQSYLPFSHAPSPHNDWLSRLSIIPPASFPPGHVAGGAARGSCSQSRGPMWGGVDFWSSEVSNHASD